MRTLRLSVAGIVIYMLLGGLAGVVVAQPDVAEEVSRGLTSVTGTRDFARAPTYGTVSHDGDRWRYRGIVDLHIMEVDDPRLNGAMWTAWSKDALPDPNGAVFGGVGGALQAGSSEIINDDGSWQGTARGYQDPATMVWLIEFDLVGTGAYEGYSARLHVRGPGEPKSVDGVIIPGTWPAYPDPVEVPAE